jgi:hypothetical protein
MADPVATVEKIVKIGLRIKDAVDTVRHNEEECREIRRRVLRFSAILSQLQQAGLMDDSPALSGALEDLEGSLQKALELVTACQERSTIRRLVSAGDLAKQLGKVKDDILNKVMLASFAINAHTTIVLLTIQAGGHPLHQQQEVHRYQCSYQHLLLKLQGLAATFDHGSLMDPWWISSYKCFPRCTFFYLTHFLLQDTRVTESTSLNSHSTKYIRCHTVPRFLL